MKIIALLMLVVSSSANAGFLDEIIKSQVERAIFEVKQEAEVTVDEAITSVQRQGVTGVRKVIENPSRDVIEIISEGIPEVPVIIEE